MATTDDDNVDVAQYVLAYLVNNNYSQTMSAFVKECPHLAHSSLLILPSPPLKDIIKNYRAQQSTSALVNTLGNDQAWKLLWDKLHQTLNQLNNLAHGIAPISGKKKGKVKVQHIFQQGMSSSSNLCDASSPSGSVSADNESIMAPTAQMPITSAAVTGSPANVFPLIHDSRSPRKKRTLPPKRKQQELNMPPIINGSSSLPVENTPGGNQEEIQQILDMLLTNQDLPNKLADLINQHVESTADHDDDEQPLPFTIDNILTCTDLLLDELVHPLHSTGSQRSLNSTINTPPLMLINTDAGDTDGSEGPSTNKRQCLDEEIISSESYQLPSGTDLERFLDQLHNNN